MICSRCIYDDTIPYITFDENGVCNYCYEFDKLNIEYPIGEKGWNNLYSIAEKIKKHGRKNKYDLVVGVSGGCDSSYMLYLTKEKLGLRPLAVNFDNGWGTQIADDNLKKMCGGLNVDLKIYGVDKAEYDDVYKSEFKASVIELEAMADIAVAVSHYMACEEFGIKYVFEGRCFRTEGIVPPGWSYMDTKYVDSMHKQFGSTPIKTIPMLWLSTWMKWTIIDRIKKFRPLYNIDYNKEEVKTMLNSKFGWQWYGSHHAENKTSYFLNNYYLPKKFGIDIRYSEYAAFVRSGKMSKQDALNVMGKPSEFNLEVLEEFKQRLGLTDEEFEIGMNAPKKSYRDYKTYKKTFERLKPLFWIMYKLDLVPKSFYLKYATKLD